MTDLKVVSKEVTVGWTEALGSQGSGWKEQVLHSTWIDSQLAWFMSSQIFEYTSKRSPSRAAIKVSHSSIVVQTVILVAESAFSASYSRRLFLFALN